MTTASASCLAPDQGFLPILDPNQFPTRDHLIRHLVGQCNWSCRRVARYFNLSDRQVRRLTTPELLLLNLARPAATSSLTSKEIEAMARDYASDPFITAEERDAAFHYLKQGCPLVPN